MHDILGKLAALQRPRLLVRAARIAAQSYRREHHLRPILGSSHLPRHAVALLGLSEIEAEMNAWREMRKADYSVTRHVNVLTALMAESRLMRDAAVDAPCPGDDQRNASASAALRSATKASSASLIAGSSAGC